MWGGGSCVVYPGEQKHYGNALTHMFAQGYHATVNHGLLLLAICSRTNDVMPFWQDRARKNNCTRAYTHFSGISRSMANTYQFPEPTMHTRTLSDMVAGGVRGGIDFLQRTEEQELKSTGSAAQ